MPAIATAPEAASGLRLLVFGLPGSGKSSLLGALVQAGASQAAVLKGQLADDTGNLAELRKSTYTGKLSATTAAMTAYPVHFTPQGREANPIAATLLDGDGRLAHQYLSGKRPLEPRDSELARAMLLADTVILTFDASAAGGPAEPRLAAFVTFLTQLKEVRGRRADIAGLPVYLVLTKCDELAKPGDTLSQWLQRMEEAKRKLGERFAAFLADDAAGPAFGTIDLQLWACAIGRPALADRPEPAAEPCGVAELFRQCLAAAEAFDRREHQAGRRLEWTVGGLGFLVVMLSLLAGLFAAAQPDTERNRLAEEIQAALPEPDAPAGRRLRAPLRDRLDQLEKLQQDPAYEKLPTATRDAVRRTADEWTSYLQARRDFQVVVKQPYLAKNEEEFTRFEKQARAFDLPENYTLAWQDTSLARQRDQARDEYAQVRAALADKLDWIRARIDDGKKLDDQAYSEILPKLLNADAKTKDQVTKPWFAACAAYRQQPSYRRPAEEAVPGVTSFIYADLDKFHEVREARKRWDKVRRDLEETRDLVAKKVAQ